MKNASLTLIPEELAAQSISRHEIVLPLELALAAVVALEARGVHILGWEGWEKAVDGRVGHGTAPQGTVSLESLSVKEAAAVCTNTMREEARKWEEEHHGAKSELFFCITVSA